MCQAEFPAVNKKRRYLCAALLTAIAVERVCAQTVVLDATASYTFSVAEVDRTSGAPSVVTPGLIDPTEAVRLTLAVSFTPNIGATANYTPAIPLPGTGVVVGWAQTFLRLVGTGSTDGEFAGFLAAEHFSLVSAYPEPGGLESFGAWSPGVFFNTPNINASNPIESIIAFTWIPASYTPRTVSFRTATPTGGNGPSQRIGLRIEPPGGATTTMFSWLLDGRISHADTGAINIVPAPASCALLAIACVPWRRRRTALIIEPRLS
jgi:hypothetical protein